MYSGKEEARKRQLEDPIVFKANEIGAIIATMWDTEANRYVGIQYFPTLRISKSLGYL